MVILRASVRSQKVREEKILLQKSCMKKVTQNVVKRLPQMCTTVQLWVGKGEGSFFRALAWWERWEGTNPRWRTMLVLVVPLQTFQLDFKRFSSENEL
jgi:hypothetical protein